LYSKFYPLYKGVKPGYLSSKIKITSDEKLKYLKLPENFAIQIFAKGVNGARVIKEDPAGNLIVSLTKEVKIVSLPDLNQDGRADKVIIFLPPSSPLGLAFFPEEGWPEKYWHNLLVAYHGSWNRTVPTGYKIVRYILDSQGKYLGKEDFITGWLQVDEAIGRPVDILIKPGGIIYISDDKAGVIYRVIYKNN
jgi:glucose/arabinose dehydrogenase